MYVYLCFMYKVLVNEIRQKIEFKYRYITKLFLSVFELAMSFKPVTFNSEISKCRH